MCNPPREVKEKIGGFWVHRIGHHSAIVMEKISLFAHQLDLLAYVFLSGKKKNSRLTYFLLLNNNMYPNIPILGVSKPNPY